MNDFVVNTILTFKGNTIEEKEYILSFDLFFS